MSSQIHSKYHGRWRLTAGLSVLLLLFSSVGVAQDEPVVNPGNREPAAQSDDKSLTALRERVAQIAPRLAEGELDDAGRRALTEQLNRVTADLDAAENVQRRNAELKEQLQGLADQVETLKAAPDVPELPDLTSTPTPELENLAATTRLNITSAEQDLTSLQQALDESADHRKTLQQQTVALDQSVEEAASRLRQLPGSATSVSQAVERLAAESSRLRTIEQRALAQTSLAELDAELALNLPALRVARQQQFQSVYQQQLKDLQAELESRRQQESREQLDQARREQDRVADIGNPQVRELGERRVELAAENDALTQTSIPRWERDLTRRESALTRLRDEERKIRDRVHRFGTDATAGRELMHFRTLLPDDADLRGEMTKVDELMAELRLLQMEIIDDQTAIKDLMSDADRLTDDETRILQNVSEVLRPLEQNRSRLFSLLSDLHGTDRESRQLIEDWSSFVSEHALWLRSHEPLSLDDLSTIAPEVRQLRSSFAESLQRRRDSIGSSVWLLLIPAGIALLILVAVQEKAKRGLVSYGDEAESRTCVSIIPTFKTVLLSFGMAAEWPLMMMLVGSLLRVGAFRIDALAGAGIALGQLGGIALWLNVFRQFLRSDGLGARHLNWNPVIRERLRQWLHVVMLLVAVPVFLYLVARNVEPQSGVIHRLLFLVLMLVSCVLNWRLVGGRHNAFVNAIAGQSVILRKTRLLWVALIVGIPLVLAICSAAGFHHTATSIWDRLGWTLLAASLVVLVRSLVVRWMQVDHRATRLALARERAQQREQMQQASQENAVPAELALAAAAETTPDRDTLAELDDQANRLIRNAAILVMIGCTWMIWFDVLPALKILDRQELWGVREQVAVTQFDESGNIMLDESGNEIEKLRTEIRPVTIVSLLLALFTAVVTTVGVRQLPGLVEVILLRRMKFDAGIRYAVTTVVRYVVLITGTVIAFRLLGLRWTQVQWLAAGLSVGLGFGLQEVFANFVSGIIILLERPIRIGDIVTIDGVTGIVSRIQIRATSLTDWDHREFIVPNKELVTGKLLNWTLSDATNRIVIHVGVAYETDTPRAREIMLQLAQEHPNVLEDPAPIATFESFDDSSLGLILRAYLPDLNNRLTTITELHTKIHEAFAEAGIQIAFPQREIRVLS